MNPHPIVITGISMYALGFTKGLEILESAPIELASFFTPLALILVGLAMLATRVNP